MSTPTDRSLSGRLCTSSAGVRTPADGAYLLSTRSAAATEISSDR